MQICGNKGLGKTRHGAVQRSWRCAPAPRCSWRPRLGSSRWGTLFSITQVQASADIWVSRDPTKPNGKTHSCAGMKDGLVVSPAWWLSPPGIAVAYERALRLTRRIYVSAACQAAHPDGMLALRRMIALGRCDTAGSRCQVERNWETFQGRASHRRTSHGQREYVALATPKAMNEEPYSILPRVCRQTFGAFARGMTRIMPSRGPRLAGREATTPGSVPSEKTPGGAWSPEPASPTWTCLHVLVA
jgi:hypothetical protein